MCTFVLRVDTCMMYTHVHCRPTRPKHTAGYSMRFVCVCYIYTSLCNAVSTGNLDFGRTMWLDWWLRVYLLFYKLPGPIYVCMKRGSDDTRSDTKRVRSAGGDRGDRRWTEDADRSGSIWTFGFHGSGLDSSSILLNHRFCFFF